MSKVPAIQQKNQDYNPGSSSSGTSTAWLSSAVPSEQTYSKGFNHQQNFWKEQSNESSHSNIVIFQIISMIIHKS